VRRAHGFERYGTLDEWLSTIDCGIVGFSPNAIDPISDVDCSDSWLLFGPSMGFRGVDFSSIDMRWASVPGGTLNSRDAVPIVLWEVSSWRAR